MQLHLERARKRTHEAGRTALHRQASALLGRCLAGIGAWRARARQRRALGRLDDRLLRDVGLTPLQARGEHRRPFWRG